MYKYDIRNDEWEDTNRPMRVTRSWHSCLLLNKEIFVVGGYLEKQQKSSIFKVENGDQDLIYQKLSIFNWLRHKHHHNMQHFSLEAVDGMNHLEADGLNFLLFMLYLEITRAS